MPCFTLILVLWFMGLFGLGSKGSISQVQSAVLKPCDELAAVGRPVLKRRGPTPAVIARDEQLDNKPTVENRHCIPNDAQSESVARANQVQIEFEGLHAFTPSDVLKVLREEHVELPKAQLASQESINKVAAALKDLLRTKGYMDASVGGYIAEDLRFVVQEGNRYPISSLLFEGNKHFSSEELASELRQYLADYSRDVSGYDRDLYNVCLRRLSGLLRSRGYLQAKCGDPTISVLGTGLTISVPIDEGRRYRLGDIHIEGAELLSPEEVRLLLVTAKGEIANGERIAKWLFEDLRRIYGEKGFIEYTAEPTPVFKNDPVNSDEGIVDLSIYIEEGQRFILSSVTFVGDGLSQAQLSDLVLLRVGDFYNERLIDESIVRLNNLGLFEPVDKNKDLDFSTNEEERKVAVVIAVKKKGNRTDH